MPDSNINKKKSKIFVTFIVPLLAFLGAAGIGFQNFSAFSEVLVTSLHLSSSQAFALAVAAGGICSTVVNFCLNAELLHNFYKRVVKNPSPVLSTPAKAKYFIGMFVFIITGILFGLTAFSVAGVGGLAALGWAAILAITVGVFVSLITIFQELETWLESFDNLIAIEIYKKCQKLEQDKSNELDTTTVLNRLVEKLQKLVFEEQALSDKNKEIITQLQKLNKSGANSKDVISALKKIQIDAEAVQLNDSLIDSFKKWWAKLNPARFIGLIISLGNVIALSLLFTIGLTTFLTWVGVAALPALIIGFSVAFTAGAFTEFYFYERFLTNFCDKIQDKWKELFKTQKWGIGLITVITNGTINAVLAYFGVNLMLGPLLAAAGILAPPLLPIAIVSAVFTGAASLLLGTDFWIRNAKKFASWFEDKPEKQSDHHKDEREPLLVTPKDGEPDVNPKSDPLSTLGGAGSVMTSGSTENSGKNGEFTCALV